MNNFIQGILIETNRVSRVMVNRENTETIKQLLGSSFDVIKCDNLSEEKFVACVSDSALFEGADVNIVGSIAAKNYVAGPVLILGLQGSALLVDAPEEAYNFVASIMKTRMLHEELKQMNSTEALAG